MALILSIFLVYMILASQYESLLYPFVIMFAMPPIIVGVIFSLLISGRTFNVPAFIGVIMLAGIVVNNAIVMVDYINTLRRRDGLSRKEAILKAGPTRLRPILMTTLTTVLALVPLVLGIGEGAEMSAPMATAVFGGLSFSTLITLVMVPCMYIILEDIKHKMLILLRLKRKKAKSFPRLKLRRAESMADLSNLPKRQLFYRQPQMYSRRKDIMGQRSKILPSRLRSVKVRFTNISKQERAFQRVDP